MRHWEQARLEETLRLCDQTIERIKAQGQSTGLVEEVKNLRRDLLIELRRVRDGQQKAD